MPAGTDGRWTELRRRAVYEDDGVLALDKPPGISVTGERHDTDVVELAKDAGEWLMPAHRIDKVTSGLVLLAKAVDVHGPLTRQFNQRTVAKTYLAITSTTGLPPAGTIDLPLSVGRKSRVRIAARRETIRHDEGDDRDGGARWWVPDGDVFTKDRVYPSVTTFVRLAERGGRTALVVRPMTGRRHQIRVHLAWIGHAIEGDPLFEKAPETDRAHLHSWRLAVDATWRDGERLALEADPDAGFWAPLSERKARRADELLEAGRRAATRLPDAPL